MSPWKPKQHKVSSCLSISRPRVFPHFFFFLSLWQKSSPALSPLLTHSVFWLNESWLLPKPSGASAIPFGGKSTLIALPPSKAFLNNCLHIFSVLTCDYESVSTSPLIWSYILYLIVTINPILWFIQLQLFNCWETMRRKLLPLCHVLLAILRSEKTKKFNIILY